MLSMTWLMLLHFSSIKNCANCNLEFNIDTFFLLHWRLYKLQFEIKLWHFFIILNITEVPIEDHFFTFCYYIKDWISFNLKINLDTFHYSKNCISFNLKLNLDTLLIHFLPIRISKKLEETVPSFLTCISDLFFKRINGFTVVTHFAVSDCVPALFNRFPL